jgi:4-amino-4-deoxy-L-arabinose transferase-like glycosyltransferase
MATTPRSVLASAIGWVIVALVAIWLFGMVIGWIGFVLRSIVWIVLIGVLIGVYLSVKEPPDA